MIDSSQIDLSSSHAQGKKWRNLLSFGLLSFLIAWQLAVGAMLAIPFMSGQTFAFTNVDGQTGIADFVRFYAAGKIASSPLRQRAYEPFVQIPYLNEAIKPRKVGDNFYINYVPFVFALSPLTALFPLPISYLSWLACSIASATAALFGLLARTGLSRRQKIIFCLALTSSVPAAVALRTGQTTWFLFALYSLYYLCLCTSRHRLAGLLLALTTFKPQYTPFLVIAALAQKRFLTLVYSGLSLAGLLTLSGLVIGLPNVLAYPSIVLAAEALDNIRMSFYFADIRALLNQIVSPHLALQLSLALALGSLTLVFFIWRAQPVSHDRCSPAWAMSLTLLLALIFSPHTESFDCMLVGIPAALTISSPSANKPSFWIWRVTIFCYLFVPWIAGALAFPYSYHYLAMNLVLLIVGLKILRSGFTEGAGRASNQ